MQEMPFLIGEYVGMCLCVCMGWEFLIQGLVCHRPEAVNSVVLKIGVVLPSGIIQFYCT